LRLVNFYPQITAETVSSNRYQNESVAGGSSVGFADEEDAGLVAENFAAAVAVGEEVNLGSMLTFFKNIFAKKWRV
jgi:hypothetical protein